MIHFDFTAGLVTATLLAGLIWLADALWLGPRRRATGGEDAREPVVVDYARSFFPLLLIVLLLRSFVAEPFRIPSGSMIPTLQVGDFILVDKTSYGLRLPVVHTRITKGARPQRGEVAVFRYPVDTRVDFIKRVIGLPGDHVVYRDKQLFINGEPVGQSIIGGYGPYPEHALQLRNEDIGGTVHGILVIPANDHGPLEFRVPEGQYFVMGDNRDNSSDSRAWGMVPEENLVGRAFLVWMSWRPGQGPDWSRLGTRIY